MAGILSLRRGRGHSSRLLAAAGANFEALGVLSRLSSAALASKYLLVKIGADAAHIAVCAAVDTPLGVSFDVVAAAEQPVNVFPLPGNCVPMKVVASAAIALGALIEPAANGQVQTLTGTVGTHWIVGRTLSAAAIAGDVIDVVPMFFIKII